jgi:hypothetical protein
MHFIALTQKLYNLEMKTQGSDRPKQEAISPGTDQTNDSDRAIETEPRRWGGLRCQVS